MSAIYTLVIVVVCHMLLSGCVGDLKVPEEPAPAATTLNISGIENSQVVDVNYVELTIADPLKKYAMFQYALDTEKSYAPGVFDRPITVTVASEGAHVLYVKGSYADGTSDTPMVLRFNVSTLGRTASGKYSGDSLVYYANYSSMRVNFITYSGARTMGTVSGKLLLGEGREYSVSGVSIDNQQWPADVEVLLSGALAPESMRASGEGYYHYLNLKYVGLDSFNSSISGDIKLYRNDIDKFLTAYCSSMHAYNQSLLPDIEAALTLYSFDNRYFYGHVRLINPLLKKVLTYDIKGDTGAAGLTGDNNGIPLTVSKPFGYLVKPSPAPPQAGTGFVTVTSDAAGNHAISQFSINLPGYAIYDSVPESIKMMKTFAKQ